ncbi:ABC transporter permease [Streptacidiphilus rugosus]|uniref:ABC transporter permease n=1 Tax=Streptacidiphilus rugosus TaxID=405783 RepID=UPI000564C5D2|nr:ABC transporter permease [Streptacidiphilus rugosus]
MSQLIKLEVLRVLRNRRYLFFTVLFPVMMFFFYASANIPGSLNGVDAKTYYMVSMATFGTVGAALNTAMRISLERKSGWTRQLRLTALPGWAYVLSKVVAAGVVTLPAVLAVFGAGIAEGVRFPIGTWLAMGLLIWAGGFVFAAAGVALGYAAAPDAVQPITMIGYMGMAFLGGSWFPLSGGLKSAGEYTPVYLFNQLAKSPLGGVSVSAGEVAGLIAYLAVFAALAAWLYQRDRKTV